MTLSNADATRAGDAIKLALEKLVPFDGELGQSDTQINEMNEHINERAKHWVDRYTKELITETLKETDFPSEARMAVTQWCNDNIEGRVSSALDDLMCDRTRATITEYDLVRYTDDAFGEAVREAAGSADISGEIDNWFECNDLTDQIDKDNLCDHMINYHSDSIKETVVDQIMDSGGFGLNEEGVTEIIINFFKKSLHKVLGFAYLHDAVSPSEIIDERDLIKESQGHGTGYEADELTRMKLRDKRYGLIIGALGIEDTDASWSLILQKAQDNNS